MRSRLPLRERREVSSTAKAVASDLDRRKRRGGLTVLVTGGAGFIGKSVCDRLLAEGNNVIALDNLSASFVGDVRRLNQNRRFTFVEGDCKSKTEVKRAMVGADTVLHLAANPEVRPDLATPAMSFRENLFATKVVLDVAKVVRPHRIVFTSSSTVYGDAKIRPTPENYSPLVPISAYGATKLASEILIEQYAQRHRLNTGIVRLANIIGPQSRHGVVFDLVQKLKKNPKRLEVLGDGTQSKSYLYIDDCVDAILTMTSTVKGLSICNVGSEDQVSVMKIVAIVSEGLGVNPDVRLTGGVDGGRGWMGDVKQMLLDVSKIKSLGWRPTHSSEEAVRMTVKGMLAL
jgi:UDP-glucose 4-epimerase